MLHGRGELNGPPAIFWTTRRPAEELYDVVNDPDEVHNLASDPKYADTLAQLRRDLNQWLQQTDDQGQYAEVDVEATAASSDRWYQAAMKKRLQAGLRSRSVSQLVGEAAWPRLSAYRKT